MTGFPRQLSLTAAGLLCCLVVPAVAFASGKAQQKHHPAPPPATQIYMEGVATAGGTKAIPGGVPSSGSGSGAGYVQLTTKATRALQSSGGVDSSILHAMATEKALGNTKPLSSNRLGFRVGPSPSVLGATIDAGSGVWVLLVILLGSALLVAAAVVQHRRRN